VPDSGATTPGWPESRCASTGPGLRDATFTSWPASTRWRALGAHRTEANESELHRVTSVSQRVPRLPSTPVGTGQRLLAQKDA